jgi:cell division protein FtsQ
MSGERTPGRLRARHLLLLVVLAAGLLAAAVWANLWKEDLPVREVVVRGNSIVSREEIVALAAVPPGQQLFAVDLFAVRSRIVKNAYIRQASVNRDAPDRITIDVEERVPVAAVAFERMLYLDIDGVLLPHVRSKRIFDLPVLTGELAGRDLQPGKRVTSEALLGALAMLDAARRFDDALYRSISEVHLEPGGEMTLYTADTGVRVLFGRGEVAAKLAKFDAFWHMYVARRGPAALEYVDLRFEDQVVVRWRKPLAEPFPS